jgi:hypothetical protein
MAFCAAPRHVILSPTSAVPTAITKSSPVLAAEAWERLYRAKDTRPHRIVTVKVFPDHHANKSKLRERFERETTKTIAGQNHPHISTFHDIGNFGHQDGTDYPVVWDKLIRESDHTSGGALGTVAFLYLDQESVLAADVLDMRRAMNVVGKAQARFAKGEVREPQKIVLRNADTAESETQGRFNGLATSI